MISGKDENYVTQVGRTSHWTRTPDNAILLVRQIKENLSLLLIYTLISVSNEEKQNAILSGFDEKPPVISRVNGRQMLIG